MLEIIKLHESISDTLAKLRRGSEDYLKEVLQNAPDNTISIDDLVEEEKMEVHPCVTYDGGNHPEYAANPYSQVDAVYLKDGKIYLNTEDCDEYPLENVYDTDEVYNLAYEIYNTLNKPA